VVGCRHGMRHRVRGCVEFDRRCTRHIPAFWDTQRSGALHSTRQGERESKSGARGTMGTSTYQYSPASGLQSVHCALQNARQGEWDSKEFAKVRKQLNEAISLITPYYDITRVNADESDDDEEEAQEQPIDYLSPFLPKVPGTRALNREEALKVREDCLKSLRDRLIERANIIQVRAHMCGVKL
jgi:hypothetical protein